MSMHHGLERVGMRVASEQDRLLAGAELPDADVLLAGVARRRRRATVRRGALAATASAMLLVMVVFFGFRTRSGHVAASTQGPAAAALVAAHTQTQPQLGVRRAEVASVPLSFVDGTNVVVKQGAVVELREVGAHSGVIALSSGTVDVHVVHTETSRWDVLAGPFDVRVTGTRFDATWDPKTSKLTVAMVEGTVRVSGPCVIEPLSAPITKTFTCEETATPATGPTTSVHDLPTVTARGAATTTTTTEGAESNVESASVLVARADAARLAGDAAGARRIYAQVRQRSPRSTEATKSAFLLGRLAEAAGSADEAVRWYETVTRESAGGAFAQEALGRTLTLEKSRGNAARARTLAHEYLRRHPDGPYKAYAASVIDER